MSETTDNYSNGRHARLSGAEARAAADAAGGVAELAYAAALKAAAERIVGSSPTAPTSLPRRSFVFGAQ